MGRLGRGGAAGGRRRGRTRPNEESRRRSSQRRALLFPSICSFRIPSSFPQRRRAAAGPILSAHAGHGGGAGSGGALRRGRGKMGRGGLGRLDTQGKLATSISNKRRPSRSAPGAHGPHTGASTQVRLQGRIPALGRRGRAGRRRRLHRSSFAQHHRRTPSPLPCEWRRVATRIRPRHMLAAGGAGSARGGGGDPRLSPPPALDSAGATAPARRGCTPEHDCAVAGVEATTLHVCTRWRRRAAAVAAARRRRRRPLEWVPWRPFGGSPLPPHECCEGPRATFAVLPHCRLPPYPPIRVAPSATRRSAGPPGHPFPTNPTPPVQTTDPNTSTRTFIDETHVRYIQTHHSMQADA